MHLGFQVTAAGGAAEQGLAQPRDVHLNGSDQGGRRTYPHKTLINRSVRTTRLTCRDNMASTLVVEFLATAQVHRRARPPWGPRIRTSTSQTPNRITCV